MAQQEIKIKDESGDKKYYTQLPSIILNHSTANDQALYWQMKRYAGEDGKCFATQETLMKRLGIGKWAFRKSLNYLLKKGWIKYIGMTNGKTRPIKTYSIVDIWKLNIMEYEKISPEMAVSFKTEIPPGLAGDTAQNGSKIPSSLAIEEEQHKEEPLKNNIATPAVVAEKPPINDLIEFFKPVNPSYERLFGNSTQRDSLERLFKKLGREKLELILKTLPVIFGKPYAPRITTPYVLEQKLGDLAAYLQQEKLKNPKIIEIQKDEAFN